MAAPRICPECKAPYNRSGGRQIYCSPACRDAVSTRESFRGRQVLCLLQSWRKHSRGGDRKLGRFAFTQACALIDGWNREDAAAGRDIDQGARLLFEARWRAVDLVG